MSSFLELFILYLINVSWVVLVRPFLIILFLLFFCVSETTQAVRCFESFHSVSFVCHGLLFFRRSGSSVLRFMISFSSFFECG